MVLTVLSSLGLLKRSKKDHLQKAGLSETATQHYDDQSKTSFQVEDGQLPGTAKNHVAVILTDGLPSLAVPASHCSGLKKNFVPDEQIILIVLY
ncbi:hypothetical protein BpHYR1_032150 [Brachionus plicatilis]|uniref:Uncharacterized protein n=1 Tax=Brachionus plicatilis TaxID=10195 RepID=A0A3M7QA70_BRAPC|nr:hypothetical protein BpHYR1_032150 [Brachionus plicatilis]